MVKCSRVCDVFGVTHVIRTALKGFTITWCGREQFHHYTSHDVITCIPCFVLYDAWLEECRRDLTP